jgi:hypothetical protein
MNTGAHLNGIHPFLIKNGGYQQLVKTTLDIIDSHFKHGTFIYRSSNLAIFGSSALNDTIITEDTLSQYRYSNLTEDSNHWKYMVEVERMWIDEFAHRGYNRSHRYYMNITISSGMRQDSMALDRLHPLFPVVAHWNLILSRILFESIL